MKGTIKTHKRHIWLSDHTNNNKPKKKIKKLINLYESIFFLNYICFRVVYFTLPDGSFQRFMVLVAFVFVADMKSKKKKNTTIR